MGGMSSQRFRKWLRERRRRWFPERQIFIRSNGTVRFVTFSGRQQMALAAIPLAIVLAVLGTGVGLYLQGRSVDAGSHEIARLEAARRQLESERQQLTSELASERRSLKTALADWSRRYDAITSELERKHRILANLTQHKSELESRLDGMRRELDALASEREHATGDRAAINVRYLHLREQLTQASYLKAEPEGSLHRRALHLSLSFGGALDGGPRPPAERGQRFKLDVEATNRLLALTASERDAARSQKQALELKVSHLENRLSVLHEMQNNLIGRIAAGTERSIGDLENALAATGLNLDDLLGRLDEEVEGTGGPFISVPAVEAPPAGEITPLTYPEVTGALDDQFEHVLSRMGGQLARLSALNALAEHLPLAAPVEDYELRSPFGRRHDPITRRWAVHEGLDLGSARRAPILATAPGVVAAAGWKGPYGRVVEIDHGFGLMTRYAHLYRINVKRGQHVVKHQQIGIMGSSGRSTGRHLHYEVRLDGRALDPMTFLKAGDHVFKNGQN